MNISKSKAITLSLISVWASVLIGSFFAPDMITGSEHEYLPIIQFTAWIWGLIASGFIAGLVYAKANQQVWKILMLSVAAVWFVVMILTIFGPTFITGTDPTQIPLVALLAPIVGMIATAYICLYVALISGDKKLK